MLVNADELRLTTWMAETLQLTWAAHPEPWTVEAAVIEQLQPPLNQAANSGHPLYEHVRAARRRWRETAETTREVPRERAGDGVRPPRRSRR